MCDGHAGGGVVEEQQSLLYFYSRYLTYKAGEVEMERVRGKRCD